MPTLNWERMREGVDDYRYLYTLDSLAKETGEIFKSAIDYMANQSEMMSGVMDKSDKTSKELKLTRVVVFGICTAVVFIDVVSALFK